MDTDARLVKRWRPDDDRPEILDEQLTWANVGASEPVVMDLRTIFARAHGARES